MSVTFCTCSGLVLQNVPQRLGRDICGVAIECTLRSLLTYQWLMSSLCEVRGWISYVIRHDAEYDRHPHISCIYLPDLRRSAISLFIYYHPVLFVIDYLSMSLYVCICCIFEPCIHQAHHTYHLLIAVLYSLPNADTFSSSPSASSKLPRQATCMQFDQSRYQEPRIMTLVLIILPFQHQSYSTQIEASDYQYGGYIVHTSSYITAEKGCLINQVIILIVNSSKYGS